VIDDRCGGDPLEDTISLSVSGAGAFVLLRREAGLHILNRTWTDRGSGGRKHEDRDVVRVEVLPAPVEEGPFPGEEVRAERRSLREVPGRLVARPRSEVTLLHLPTMISVRVWSGGRKDEGLERATLLLRGRVEVAREGPTPVTSEPIVRRYTLGPTPLVRDRVTGRTTGRLDRVLRGDLDLLLAPPSE
jgi:protein subunit release factor A